MRAKDIERALSTIPPHPRPREELEQYATPASLATPLLLEAFAAGDIAERRVVDLGCGTGIFAIGAALMGARTVVGVELDGAALDVARREGARMRADVQWLEQDVAQWQGDADTVVMNPPFGAQARGADRAFLDAAFRTAPTVYTLHNANTRDFVESYARDASYRTAQAWRLRFPLRHQYRHQEKAVREIEVVALCLRRDGVVEER